MNAHDTNDKSAKFRAADVDESDFEAPKTRAAGRWPVRSGVPDGGSHEPIAKLVDILNGIVPAPTVAPVKGAQFVGNDPYGAVELRQAVVSLFHAAGERHMAARRKAVPAPTPGRAAIVEIDVV